MLGPRGDGKVWHRDVTQPGHCRRRMAPGMAMETGQGARARPSAEFSSQKCLSCMASFRNESTSQGRRLNHF